MPRARKGAARRQAKNRWFKQAKGNRLGRSTLWRKMREAVLRANVFATVHRRQRKRQYRELWVIRLNAAAKQHDLSYSRLIYGLKLANITLNRKMLSQIAIEDPASFEAIVAKVKDALAKPVAA
jgi:large subunit ribosomal protein L20